MGGQQSRTRKLTIENEDATGVIKVSEDVVQRLKGSEGVRNRANAVPPPQWPPQGAGDTIPYPYGGAAPPPYPFLYEPSLTSIQLRQATVEELKKNDEYWERRITDLQKNHEKMQEIMEFEYNKAIEEMGYKANSDSKKKNQKAPCVDKQQLVLSCYKKYPNEPMKCAKEVQAFAECVDTKRACVVENRG